MAVSATLGAPSTLMRGWLASYRVLGFQLAALLLLRADVRASEIVVMTSGGFTAPLLEVIPEFERVSGHKVITVFGASTGGAPDSIPVRLARGEVADLVILTAESLDALTAESRLVPGTRTALVRSRIGLVVRVGG